MIARIFQIITLVTILFASLAYAQESGGMSLLKRDVGIWDVVVKMYGNPGTDPVVSKGTETSFMLGDKWLVSHFKGEIMGATLEGIRQTGYDPVKKTFTGSWVDTLSHYATQMEGVWDEKSQTLTANGTGKTPTGNEMKTKFVFIYKEDGSREFTMYATFGDQGVKIMHFLYTKAIK